jgi:pyridoxine 5-phosphate synthase
MIPRLGVNIDHIATLRQLRGTAYPDILLAAKAAIDGGADQITVHLREDRRHIQDDDVQILKKHISVPLNLEMALSDQIIKIALKTKPEWVCLVPEKRNEVTTEGGLNVKKNFKKLQTTIKKMHAAKIKVSLFIEADLKTVELAAKLGADAVEFHTGTYCLAKGKKAESEKKRLLNAGKLALELGVRPHAGHGLDYENVRTLIPYDLFEEYNIGHSIVCRAAMVGLVTAVRQMKAAVLAP